jgi:hypothetical protein
MKCGDHAATARQVEEVMQVRDAGPLDEVLEQMVPAGQPRAAPMYGEHTPFTYLEWKARHDMTD